MYLIFMSGWRIGRKNSDNLRTFWNTLAACTSKIYEMLLENNNGGADLLAREPNKPLEISL